ncbi:phage major capsid protein [Photobacterium damselae]|uniref:phage major capsid protein n=1 Tax=Photobacterium damselae TaxID=38293 RepID=UPI00165E47C4|nr:phage major capsid protein [Photobacterium damselae]
MEIAQKIDSVLDAVKSAQTEIAALKAENAEIKEQNADLRDAFAGVKAANDEEIKAEPVDLKAKFFEIAKTGEGIQGTEFVKGGEIKSAAFNVTDGASAGMGVLTDVNKQILTRIVEDYAITKLFGRDTAQSTKYERKVQVGVGSARWEGENVTLANGAHTGSPTFATIKMTHGKAIAKPVVTAEALKDPFFNAESFLMNDTRKQLARLVAEGLVNGIGGENQPKGFMAYFDAVEGVKDVATRKVDHYPVVIKAEKDLAEDAALIAELQNMQYELKTGYVAGSKYVMSRKMFQRVAGMKDAVGHPFMQASLDQAVAGRIFGFDIVVDPMLGEDKPVVFGRIADAFKVIDIPTSLEFIRNPYKIDGAVEFYIATRVGTIVADNEAVVALIVNSAEHKAK